MAVQEGRIELELFCTLTDEEVRSRGLMLVWAIDDTNSSRTAAMKNSKNAWWGSRGSNANWRASFTSGPKSAW